MYRLKGQTDEQLNFDGWDEYTPLGDTRDAFRISKYIILMKKQTIQNAEFECW